MYKIVLEMCSVRHVEMKSVFTLELTKRPDSTTVESANSALTWRKFLLMIENRQLRCLVVMEHNALREK